MTCVPIKDEEKVWLVNQSFHLRVRHHKANKLNINILLLHVLMNKDKYFSGEDIKTLKWCEELSFYIDFRAIKQCFCWLYLCYFLKVSDLSTGW